MANTKTTDETTRSLDGTEVVRLATSGANWKATVSAIKTFIVGTFTGLANPTASVGTSVVNGTATTAMRSDAAPALDVTISPTWTGSHVFNKNTASAPANAGGDVLQVVAADGNVSRLEADAFGQIAAVTVRRANNTNASKTALASGDQIGAFNYHGYYVTGGPAYSGVQASIQGLTTQNWTSTALGTKVVISTTPNGSTTLTTAATFGQDQGITVVGPAIAPTLALGGATIGSNALAVTGQVLIKGTGTSGAGATSLMNLQSTSSANPFDAYFNFLKTDGTVLWNVGSSVLTGTAQEFAFYDAINSRYALVITNAGNIRAPSGASWAFSSATDGSGATDALITRGGPGSIQLGAADAASPVAQTLKAQGSRAGTDSNVAAPNLTIAAPLGTGNSTAAKLLLNSPVAVASGTGAQTSTTGLAINVGTAVLTNYTVANLPAAATAGAGATAFVTDGSTTFILGLGLTVAGGGANKVPVYSDGTNWIVG